MPRLAQRFMVVAVDLPGIGRSAPPAGGYDAANLADLYRLAGAKCCRTAPVLNAFTCLRAETGLVGWGGGIRTSAY